jgi:hypothetical protein
MDSLPPKENTRRGLFFNNPQTCFCGKKLWGAKQTGAFILCNDCWGSFMTMEGEFNED